MSTPTLTILVAVLLLLMLISSCSHPSDRQLAEMAERHLEREAQHNRQLAELQKQIADGTRQLIAADAESRTELAKWQREVNADRIEIGRQRDLLEAERREQAEQRARDPIIATAISQSCLLMACILPLILCWYLLHSGVEPADDHAVANVLLQDLVIREPLLLSRADRQRGIALRESDESRPAPDAVEDADNPDAS